MASVVEICNMAIRALGSGKTIASLVEKSEEARACNSFFDSSRDKVLVESDWPFARNYATLGLVASSPNGDWAYAYQYPSDCLMALKIVGPVRTPARNQEIPFERGNLSGSQAIFTDQVDAILKYTQRVTNTGLYPADFLKALYLYLATQIGPSITGGDPFKSVSRVGQLYLFEVSQAKANRANESTRDVKPEAESITIRG